MYLLLTDRQTQEGDKPPWDIELTIEPPNVVILRDNSVPVSMNVTVRRNLTLAPDRLVQLSFELVPSSLSLSMKVDGLPAIIVEGSNQTLNFVTSANESAFWFLIDLSSNRMGRGQIAIRATAANNYAASNLTVTASVKKLNAFL